MKSLSIVDAKSTTPSAMLSHSLLQGLQISSKLLFLFYFTAVCNYKSVQEYHMNICVGDTIHIVEASQGIIGYNLYIYLSTSIQSAPGQVELMCSTQHLLNLFSYSVLIDSIVQSKNVMQIYKVISESSCINIVNKLQLYTQLFSDCSGMILTCV